jgi:hypothetical protein
MLPSDFRCPSCKCSACYALHRKGIDWIASLLGLRPARCLTCSRKFYARYTISQEGKYIVAPTGDAPQSGPQFNKAA